MSVCGEKYLSIDVTERFRNPVSEHLTYNEGLIFKKTNEKEKKMYLVSEHKTIGKYLQYEKSFIISESGIISFTTNKNLSLVDSKLDIQTSLECSPVKKEIKRLLVVELI